MSTGTTIMKTFRAPGIEELFSDGPHLAAYSYEIGNVELEPVENMAVFEVENLFDTAYREHLSLIKAVMPEPGRNVKFLYKLNF